MIKNPKIGQQVYYFHNLRPIKGIVNQTVLGYAVEVDSQYRSFLGNNEIFATPQAAIKDALKKYNKQILNLSKKREKLASRLAEILDK